jgi:hypothetical protein
MFNSGETWGALVMFSVGPGVATVVGQIGGALGGRRAIWQLQAKMAARQSLMEFGWKPAIVLDECHLENVASEAAFPRVRFRIIHLLWIGVWLSLLLTLIRLSRVPYELILPLVVGWLIYQAATLAIGGWLVCRLGPWWRARRQTRST